MWYVYILRCGNSAFYTGVTSDLARRFEEHRSGRGARYTRMFGVEALAYFEKCRTRRQAMQREARIKTWSRGQKMALVGNGWSEPPALPVPKKSRGPKTC